MDKIRDLLSRTSTLHPARTSPLKGDSYAQPGPESRHHVVSFSFALLVAAPPAPAQVSLTTLGVAYTQSLRHARDLRDDESMGGQARPSLAGTGSAPPLRPTRPPTRAYAGGSNAGGHLQLRHRHGDRAGLRSASSGTPVNILNAVRLVNNTTSTITSLDVAFVGEQRRAGGCTPTAPATTCTPLAQKLDFQYQIASAGTITDANTPSTGWTDHDALELYESGSGRSGGCQRSIGNAAANRLALSSTVTVSVAPGQGRSGFVGSTSTTRTPTTALRSTATR